MWVATVGFSLVGLLMVAVGPDMETRLAGAGATFFGTGGGAYLWMTRRRDAPAPVVELGRTRLLGVSEAGVEIPIRPPFNLAFSFGFGLVLGGALIALGVGGGGWIPLGLGVLNTALCLYVGGAYIRRWAVRPRLVLTISGLAFEHPVSSVAVRWRDIEGLILFTQHDMLHIGVQAPRDAVVQRTGSRALIRFARVLTGAAITVPTRGLSADPDRLLDALADYVEDPGPLRQPERERAALTARLASSA